MKEAGAKNVLIDFHLFFLHLCAQGGDRRKLSREREEDEDENEWKRRKTKFASIILIYTRLFFFLSRVERVRMESTRHQKSFSYFSSCPGLGKEHFCINTFFNLMKKIFLISMLLWKRLRAFFSTFEDEEKFSSIQISTNFSFYQGIEDL